MTTLKIFTNDDIWRDTAENRRYGHLGTCDREDPSIRYDKPGKTSPLLAVARELVASTHRDGDEPRITLSTSHRKPDQQLLLQGHTREYLDRLESASIVAKERVDRGDVAIAPFGKEADVSPGTYQAALSSVGAALDAVDSVHTHPHTTAFALVWPPGHHAEPDQAMGFCYLSTAALAAIYARDHSPRATTNRTSRVALIDIDHHRGNGSAAVLTNQPDILLIDQVYRSPYDDTARRYTDGIFDPSTGLYAGAGKEYPYTREDTSIGARAHPVIQAQNILHVEHEGFQSADTLITKFADHALPRLIDFQPDLVIWSVGLDSAVGDPLGGLGMTPDAFYTLIKGCRLALPNARHCGILEGGYDPAISAPCLRSTLLGFSDEPQQFSVASFERYAHRFVTGR
jgi:acetoin utilization deacetylase AcuC-like enzyme